MFHIEDWAGNRMFPDNTFATFEDGWDFVLSQFPDDADCEDIYVVDKVGGE